MIVKLWTEHHLEFLILKGGCRGLSESSLVKKSNCWKSHAAAHFALLLSNILVNAGSISAYLRWRLQQQWNISKIWR